MVLRPGAEDPRPWFEREGFDVSDVVAGSFSVSGDADLFERKLDERAASAAEDGTELSRQRLPDEVGGAVEAIVFTPGEPLA